MTTTRQKLTRYGSSLAVVLAVHGVAIAIALHWTSAPAPVELPPAAMIVEMPPMPEIAPPPPPKVVQPPTPPAPVEEPPLPKVAEAPKPTIALPKPKPKPPKPQPPKPEKKPEPPQDKPVAEKPLDTPPAPPAPVVKSAAPAPSIASNPDAKPSWEADLLRHLAKFKRYPDDARRRGLVGTVKLKFVVDAQGNVLSYEIVGESGSASLDRATLEMIRKAQPLPPPPKELLTSGSVQLTAPFVFSLDKGR